jgi:DNA gyrase subunit B
LADVSNSKVPFIERELYLVEGDSAGGTAKLARNRDFQATFSLKGKPLNVMETTKDKVNANAEVAGIFAGIGLDLSAQNPISKIRFGKIIFLADPDVDGRHINTLLMALFWKYLPDLFKEGRVFMVASPEYLARHKGKVYFGTNKESIYKQCGSDKVDIRHIKGWGEISAEDMQPIAFKKGKRRLWQVMPPRDKKGTLQFTALMGKDSTYRKKLLGIV